VGRPRYPRHTGPPPPALPPVAQTIGQLVAETVRLYGSRFLLFIPLGVPLAIADQVALDRSRVDGIVVLGVAAPAFSAAYVAACAIVYRARPGAGMLVAATVVGAVVFLPAAAFFTWFALASVAWLALMGHTVPVMVVEHRAWRDALGRSVELARADYVHALGGLATFVILFGLTRIALAGLLRSQAENTVRVSLFLADVVLGPLLFVGGALLYANLSARVGVAKDERRAIRDAGGARK
jgi:hypothetical protein